MRRIAAFAAVLALLAACDSGEPAAEPAPVATSAAPASAARLPDCAGEVPSRVLPEWARAGFSEAEPRMPFVLGDQGDIAAIIFGYPLRQPTAQDRSNKILWVSRVEQRPGEPLVIEASLTGKGEAVTREVRGGAGPSIIDLPEAGCWHLQLKWSGHTDTMQLTYQG